MRADAYVVTVKGFQHADRYLTQADGHLDDPLTRDRRRAVRLTLAAANAVASLYRARRVRGRLTQDGRRVTVEQVGALHAAAP